MPGRAFKAPPSPFISHTRISVQKDERVSDNSEHGLENTTWERRSFLNAVSLLLPMFVTIPAHATPFDNFNILTSKPLEQLRILTQEDADNRVYDGELASPTGDAPTPVVLLVPIIRLKMALMDMNSRIESPNEWDTMRQTLSTSPFAKKAFKKIFNAFADNIYYTDADRANVYLGGGATPSTMQTTQYLLRNDILGNVENAEQELEYLIRIRDEGNIPRDKLLGEELDDLRIFFRKALESLDKYLSIPPKGDVELAVSLIRK